MVPTETSVPELDTLLESLDEVGPNALTSCPGWTAHHVGAHICGNYEEIRLHVEAFADSRPLDRTRSWEERESPLRELGYTDLLHRIAREATSTASIISDVVADQPDATLAWTGRTVAIAGFATHLRSEDTLHRWDLVGDDDVSFEQLGQQDLLKHAVRFIGTPLLRRGLSTGPADGSFVARIRSAGADDLVLEAADGDARVSVESVKGAATIEADPPARLLMLWGRKPMPFHRLKITDHSMRNHAARAQALLSGY